MTKLMQEAGMAAIKAAPGVAKRLKEPSSMAGLAAIVAALFPQYAAIAAPVLGLLAVFIPEGGA